MKKSEMREHIRMQSRVSIPALQAEFSLKYTALRALFREMESAGEIALDRDGLNYRVIKRKRAPADSDDAQRCMRLADELHSFPSEYQQVVEMCARTGSVSLDSIERKLSISGAIAAGIMHWMEAVGVTKQGDFNLKREEWRAVQRALGLLNGEPPKFAEEKVPVFHPDIDEILREESETTEKEENDASEPQDDTEEEDSASYWDKKFREMLDHGRRNPSKKRRHGQQDDDPDSDPDEDDPDETDPEPQEDPSDDAED